MRKTIYQVHIISETVSKIQLGVTTGSGNSVSMLCMFQHVILWHRNLAETRLPTLALILLCDNHDTSGSYGSFVTADRALQFLTGLPLHG